MGARLLEYSQLCSFQLPEPFWVLGALDTQSLGSNMHPGTSFTLSPVLTYLQIGGPGQLDEQVSKHSDQVHEEEKPKYEGLQFWFL